MGHAEGNTSVRAHVLSGWVFWGQEAPSEWWGPCSKEGKGRLASLGFREVSVGEVFKDSLVQTDFTDGEIEAKEGMWGHRR